MGASVVAERTFFCPLSDSVPLSDQERMIDDATLLQRYATEHSEEAFAELVRRHLPLVYAAACRRLEGQTHRAADVSQSVFIALARNARQLSRHPVLTGWLYTATRYAALDAIRAERRRQAREQEASAMEEISRPESATADWEQLRPFIDQVFDELGEREREALLLRFFQGRPFAEIGTLLGLSEEAARKRVDRALDKLRGSLDRRGLTSTSVVLASVLAAGSAAAVPAGLATSITSACITTAGAVAVGAFSFLSKATLAWSAAAVSLAAGTIGFIAHQRTDTGAAATPATRQLVAADAEPAKASAAMTISAPTPGAAAPVNTSPLPAPTATPAAPTIAGVAITPARTPRVAMPTSSTSTPTDATTAGPPVGRPISASPEEIAKLRRRYDPFLIGQRGLSEAQAARFVDLKLAIAEAQADLQAGVRQAGALGGTAGVEALRSQLVKPMWDEIHQMLGPEGSKLYSDYEQTSAYRPTVVEMFRAARQPLSDEQTDQLVRLVLKNRQTTRAQPTDIYTSVQIDWSDVARDAAGLLSPEQLAILQARAERAARR